MTSEYPVGHFFIAHVRLNVHLTKVELNLVCWVDNVENVD